MFVFVFLCLFLSVLMKITAFPVILVFCLFKKVNLCSHFNFRFLLLVIVLFVFDSRCFFVRSLGLF